MCMAVNMSSSDSVKRSNSILRFKSSNSISSYSTDAVRRNNSILRVKSSNTIASTSASSVLDVDSSRRFSSISSSSCKSSSSNSVRFQNVKIREYGIILGDNPSCSNGPPIGLSWDYDQDGEQEVPLDVFEQWRVGQRRSITQMKLPASVRFETLRSWDVQMKDMRANESELKEIKSQRRRTLVKVQRKETMKQLTQKLKRTLSFRRQNEP